MLIVDAAHSVGQLDFKLPDLKADFIGINLHKWIGAPLGVGAIYVRRDRLSAIDPDPAETRRARDILPPGSTPARPTMPRSSLFPPRWLSRRRSAAHGARHGCGRCAIAGCTQVATCRRSRS